MFDSATGDELYTPLMTKADCEEGYYCEISVSPNRANSWPTNTTTFCDVGQYCPMKSTVAIACDPGFFQFNKVQEKCIECPAGYFCDDPSVIDKDNFVGSYKCFKGHYCPQGTVNGDDNPCPPGTYNPNFGAKALSECIPAPPGFYIANHGQDALVTTDLCDAGYYCMLGSYTATPAGGNVFTENTYTLLYNDIGGPCEDGFYCPEGTPYMIPCTPGYICDNAINGGPVTVPTKLCDAGYYCEQGTYDSIKDQCPRGYYCIEGSAEPIPCPAGTYSNTLEL